jgi:hypothetical protein
MARFSIGRCIKKMAQPSKTINGLPPELIAMILQHVPERPLKHKYLNKAPGPAKSMLTWGQLSTGVCFGLTSRRHWEIFRSLVPKDIPLYPALSRNGKWICQESNYQAASSEIEPDSLIFLLESWMKPKYRIPHQSEGCMEQYLIGNFISCDTYGKDSYTRSHQEKERQLKLAAWKALGHKVIPHPFNMGKDWYFAAGQALKAMVLNMVEVPTRDPRRDECNWDRGSEESCTLWRVSFTIMANWLKAVAHITPIHFDPEENDLLGDGLFFSKTQAAEMVEDILMIPNDQCDLNALAQDCKVSLNLPAHYKCRCEDHWFPRAFQRS